MKLKDIIEQLNNTDLEAKIVIASESVGVTRPAKVTVGSYITATHPDGVIGKDREVITITFHGGN